MAINVNTVYTTVLSILNKEQRGYITPDEFNKLGTQVQLEIFEKFFEDYNQYIRMPKTDVEFASRMDHIHEEFQVFEKTNDASAVASNVYTQPVDLHRFGSVFYEKANGAPEIEIVSKREYHQLKLSPLTQPSLNFPVGVYQQDKVTVYPALTTTAVSDIGFNYIRKPANVVWGFTVGSLGQYIYSSTKASSLLASTSLMSSVTTPGTGATGPDGPYTYEPAISSGGGTDGKITITILGGNVTDAVVSAVDVGYGYSVGDTITFSGGGLTQPLVITLQASDLLQGSMYSNNFEISDSQQTEAILKILQYAGIVIRDPNIVQAAAQELAQDEANTKR